MASQNAEDVKALLDVISTLFKQGGGPDVKDRLMELREAVLGLWAGNTELKQENLELKQENSVLKSKIAEKQSLHYESNIYWLLKDDGTRDGPYCPACHDDKSKLIRMRDNGAAYCCNVCNFAHRYAPHNPVPRMRSDYF